MPNRLDFTRGVYVPFFVLVSNSVQVILQTFQQRNKELLRILLTAYTHTKTHKFSQLWKKQLLLYSFYGLWHTADHMTYTSKIYSTVIQKYKAQYSSINPNN